MIVDGDDGDDDDDDDDSEQHNWEARNRLLRSKITIVMLRMVARENGWRGTGGGAEAFADARHRLVVLQKQYQGDFDAVMLQRPNLQRSRGC